MNFKWPGGVFPKCFTEFAEFIDKKNLKIKRIAVFEPTISRVIDRDETTVTHRHKLNPIYTFEFTEFCLILS